MKFNLHLMHNIATMQMYHTRGSMLRSKTRSSMRGGVGGNKQSMEELINGVSSIYLPLAHIALLGTLLP